MPSWLRQKLEGNSEPSASSSAPAAAPARRPRAKPARDPPQQSPNDEPQHRAAPQRRGRYAANDDGGDSADGGSWAGASKKRPRAAASSFGRPAGGKAGASVQDFWSDESDEDIIEDTIEEPAAAAAAAAPASRPRVSRAKRPRSAPQQRRVRKEPRRAAAIPSEDDDGDYLTPESLDPNKPEFPKLVDPPFRSANVPLELRPSDELKGGQATLDAPPVDAAALTVPASAAQYLREYQKEGVKWLYQQYIRQLGGVLGDDMGLGKTCMCVNFLAAVLKKTCMPSDRMGCGADDGRCCLIVVPSSVIHQWQSEFERWVHTQVATINKGSDVAPIMRKVHAGSVVEVVIVGHDRFRLSADEICSYDWHLAIFDEAHKMKNANAKLVEATHKLKTKRRYGLTGTPIQNNFQELYTLLDLMTPGCLGESSMFHEYYTKPFSVGQKHDATPQQKRKGSERQAQLNELINKWVLRRDKSLIADQLPGKDDNVVFCKLAGMQTRAYERFLALPDVQLLVRSKEMCDCGSGEQRSRCCYKSDPAGVLWPFYHSEGEECKQCPHCCLFPAMQKLIQISNHLALLRPRQDDKPEKQEFDSILWEELTHGERPEDLEDKYVNTSSAAHCGKLRVTKMLLRQFQEEGSKVLLFSFSTKLLDIIEQMVEVEGYIFSRLDGNTPQKTRGQMCAKFNNDPSEFLMLVSTHAGGLGLNLASADKVIIFDPNWNPSYDLQAQDRAFRIGQQRFVSVYRLITSGTIEEVIYNRQVAKQQMANATLKNSRERRYFQGVMGPNGKWIEDGELGGIKNLFSLTKDEVTTKEIEAREHARAKLNIRKIPRDIMDGAENR